jgi:hypothetical protein
LVGPPRAAAEPVALAATPAEEPASEPPTEDVAARLEAALKGHLESVASALSAARKPSPMAKEGNAASGRSIHAPDGDAAKEADSELRLPPAMPFAMGAFSDSETAASPLRDEEDEGEAEFAEAYAAEEHPAEEIVACETVGAYDDPSYDDATYDGAEPFEADEEAFRLAPPAWIGAEDHDEEDDPLPAALLRHSRRDPEPVAHLPPLVETARGISAKTLAVAALFGLAAGVGAIAAYQFSVAPVASPALAVAPSRPLADSTKIVKLDADRVPQADDGPGIKVAAATATPNLADPSDPPAGAPVVTASATAADKPAPEPVGPAAANADPAAPALRPTEDAGAVLATADVPSDAEVPSDTEPFVATASIRKAAPKVSAGSQPLAYAPVPAPNDPVARSFFGKGGSDDTAAAAPKKSTTAAIPAPSAGKAKVVMAVNMRAKPDNDSPSIKILGAGARVQVVKCDGWCEVVAEGKRGYVFKKFLDN